MFSKWISISLFFNMIPVSICQTAKNSLYIIRNAEAASSDSLSSAGVSRATQCLPELFRPASNYNIGLIITCAPDPNSGACKTSFATAQPIAASLGLMVDTTCTSGESSSEHCIQNVISTFAAGNDSAVLLIWDENYLSDLRAEFGLRGLSQNQVDIIYTLRNYVYVSETSQNCDGINGNNEADPVPTQTVGNTFPSPPAPFMVSLPGPTSQIKPMLDLYYTTTFTIPDPIPTPPPSVMSIVQPSSFTNTGFVRKRKLHSRRSCRISLFGSQGVL